MSLGQRIAQRYEHRLCMQKAQITHVAPPEGGGVATPKHKARKTMSYLVTSPKQIKVLIVYEMSPPVLILRF